MYVVTPRRPYQTLIRRVREEGQAVVSDPVHTSGVGLDLGDARVELAEEEG
ncbi:MAG: hypothetical protein ACE5Z5_13330 [Candidatus Bathyarchaeia archaeon]